MGLLQEEDVFGEYRIFHNHDSKLLRILYIKLNISWSQVNIEMVSLFFLSTFVYFYQYKINELTSMIVDFKNRPEFTKTSSKYSSKLELSI